MEQLLVQTDMPLRHMLLILCASEKVVGFGDKKYNQDK